jgi:hypothetical protein
MKHFPFVVSSACAVGLLVSALGVSVLAQGNSSVGNWTLNVASSKYSPGPAPKSSTLKIEPAGMGVTSTVDTVLADGSTQHITYGGAYDGKDVAATGSPAFDMVSRRRISASTTEASYKKAGKVVTVNTVVVSADGKTLTNTAKGTDAQGRAVNNLQVYIRQ